jgi:hypothetical protein
MRIPVVQSLGVVLAFAGVTAMSAAKARMRGTSPYMTVITSP